MLTKQQVVRLRKYEKEQQKSDAIRERAYRIRKSMYADNLTDKQVSLLHEWCDFLHGQAKAIMFRAQKALSE